MFLLNKQRVFVKTRIWSQYMKFSINQSNQYESAIIIKSNRFCHGTLSSNNFCHNKNTFLLPKMIFPRSQTVLMSDIKQCYRSKIKTEKVSSNHENASNQSNQRMWKVMKYSVLIMGITISVTCLSLLYEIIKPNYDADGKLIEDEFSHLSYPYQLYNRIKKEFLYYKKFVQEPSRDKLLPEPIKHPYIQPPYTVVLELTDVLVHPDWTYQTGWRFKKRPGVDHFLEAISPPLFETVVYTAEQGLTIFPILDALDPQGNIMYRLFRDSTKFVDGHHVKDLDALNRDLSKVIVIDWNSESVQFHPENMLKIPRWSGNDDDTTMYDLAVFLKTIYATNVQDVREVLNYYRQFDNPLETFRENQRKLLEQMEEEENKSQSTDRNLSKAKWKPTFLKNY